MEKGRANRAHTQTHPPDLIVVNTVATFLVLLPTSDISAPEVSVFHSAVAMSHSHVPPASVPAPVSEQHLSMPFHRPVLPCPCVVPILRVREPHERPHSMHTDTGDGKETKMTGYTRRGHSQNIHRKKPAVKQIPFIHHDY